ncbi:MAG: response regulator transcription factor [Desulfobacterales bacterium]|nr:response regulator transcription factor [Desulfobacterales bacterium]MDH4010952.1 response regulator transcription factor [Desulfobacterales bacterium]
MDQKDITVFIVDDDASVRRALKRLIKVAGFKAKTFGSAREFIDSGHYQSAGVLVLDVRMPKMGGLELQKYLTDSGSDMPIIFITAHEDFQARRKALKAGAIDFLKKPFGDQALMDAIQRALNGYSSSKE